MFYSNFCFFKKKDKLLFGALKLKAKLPRRGLKLTSKRALGTRMT